MINKHETLYNDRSITFWPCYLPGVAVHWFLIFVITITWSVFLYSIFSSPMQGSSVVRGLIGNHIIIVIIISCIAFALLLFTRKIMWLRLCLSDNGISINNKTTKADIFIQWEEIETVLIHTEGWYGRKTLRLCLNEHSPVLQKYGNILSVPLGSVDCEKVLNIIPSHLLS